MKKYKIVDNREAFRNNPDCDIVRDDDSMFVVRKYETDSQGNRKPNIIVLNPRKFQEEKVIEEEEAVFQILKGNNVKEIKQV